MSTGSNYKLTMIMDIILNQVAIWRPCGTSTLHKRIVPAGTQYRDAGAAVYQRSTAPIYRYCKDYETGKGKNKAGFCLFVRTSIDNDAIVEKQLDDIAEAISLEKALSVTANSSLEAFEYLPNLIKLEEA